QVSQCEVIGGRAILVPVIKNAKLARRSPGIPDSPGVKRFQSIDHGGQFAFKGVDAVVVKVDRLVTGVLIPVIELAIQFHPCPSSLKGSKVGSTLCPDLG